MNYSAVNDRIGGWQLMYQMLQKGEWQIADTSSKLIEAIPIRMHDEKRPGDVLKVPVDPLDRRSLGSLASLAEGVIR